MQSTPTVAPAYGAREAAANATPSAPSPRNLRGSRTRPTQLNDISTAPVWPEGEKEEGGQHHLDEVHHQQLVHLTMLRAELWQVERSVVHDRQPGRRCRVR